MHRHVFTTITQRNVSQNFGTAKSAVGNTNRKKSAIIKV